jgi:cob(I)alamin adenosyltransferase
MTTKKNNQGLVYIFTGNGKGKTSAALGVALRAVGQGKRVAMVQWYKEKHWKIGEHNVSVIARSAAGGARQSRFKIYPMGQGFYKLPTDHATPDQHRQAAQTALKLAHQLLVSPTFPNPQLTTHNTQLFLLILDEATNAVTDKLISLISLIRLVRQRKSTHIILTGRNAPKKLIALADLVTEMKNIKHPYDIGKKAVIGLDF